MPVTLFAHQAPVLPLKMRSPDRWDGLGLVVGSIMPDLYYVTSGWLFGPFGFPLWNDGHRLDLIVQNCVVPGFLLTVLLRRWTMPVVPAVLPKAGFLRLRDYRLLVLSRHRWWVTAYSVLVGSLTHLALDAVTHHSLVRHAFTSVLAGAASVPMLVRISERKLQWQWHGYDTRPPDPVVDDRGRIVIWVMLAVGALAAAGYGAIRTVDGAVPAAMAFTCVCLLTLLVAGAIGRRWVAPLPAAVDPLVE